MFAYLLLFFFLPHIILFADDAKCDVWSIGVIAFMLLSGTPPFYGRSDADTLNCVKLGRWHFDEYLFKPVSADAKDFITKCLTRKAVLRPSAADALKHRWFNVLKHKKSEETTVSLQIVQRLDNFIKRTKLAKIIMDVVAHTLLPEQISDLRVQFTKFDTTESGQISLADMRAILSQFPGFKEEDLSSIFENLNIDQTGGLCCSVESRRQCFQCVDYLSYLPRQSIQVLNSFITSQYYAQARSVTTSSWRPRSADSPSKRRTSK